MKIDTGTNIKAVPNIQCRVNEPLLALKEKKLISLVKHLVKRLVLDLLHAISTDRLISFISTATVSYISSNTYLLDQRAIIIRLQ